VYGSLTANGNVSVSFDDLTANAAAIGNHPILSAASFGGISPLAWRVDDAAFAPRLAARLLVDGNEVRLDVLARGTIVIFR